MLSSCGGSRTAGFLVPGCYPMAAVSASVVDRPVVVETEDSAREAAAVEERLLLRGGCAAEHGVAVGESAEAADDVGVQFRPFEGVGIAARAVERDAALLVGEILGMLERQIEERAFGYR